MCRLNFVILYGIIPYRTWRYLRRLNLTRKTVHIMRKERLLTMNEKNTNLPIKHEVYETIPRQAVAVLPWAYFATDAKDIADAFLCTRDSLQRMDERPIAKCDKVEISYLLILKVLNYKYELKKENIELDTLVI